MKSYHFISGTQQFSFLICIGILSISLMACMNSSSVDSSLTTNNSLILNKQNFQITYPKTWYVDTSAQLATDFIVFSRLTNVNDNFKENINLLIQNLEQGLTLDQYVRKAEQQIESKIEEGYIISSERKQSKNGDYQKVIYTGTQGNYKLKFEQNYWLKSNKAYILTFTSEVHQYKFFKKIGEAIMSSFEIST